MISEVAADWHGLITSQHIMHPSIASAAGRHTTPNQPREAFIP